MTVPEAKAVDLVGTLSPLIDRVDAALERALPAVGSNLGEVAEAVRHSVFPGGKRLRPVLCLLSARAHGGAAAEEGAPALAAAAALEMVHTYSLIHDDLPCMDDAPLRRGRDACHVVYGEALAVLAGDALLTQALETLGSAGPQAGDLALVLGEAAGALGMVGGQALDLEAEGLDSPDAACVSRIHSMKTAALFGAAVEMGAVCAVADATARAKARAFGRALGMAFQARDDALDAGGSPETTGKTAGGDVAHGKATLPAALGAEAAVERSRELSVAALEAVAALEVEDPGLLADVCAYVVERDR